jgi:hypothetical protein
MRIKKMLALAVCAALLTLSLSACGDDDALALDDTYAGILAKVRIGMTLKQVKSLQRPAVNLYFASDTVVWGVDNDIELMELTTLLPQQEDDQMFYYVDDSKAIVTYYLKKPPGGSEEQDDLLLTGFSQEVACMLDRELGNAYFKAKTDALVAKHAPDATPATTVTGVEDIDLNLVTEMTLSCPSYDLTFDMTETYTTVNDVTAYYVTHYSIQIMEKAVKDTTAVTEAS